MSKSVTEEISDGWKGSSSEKKIWEQSNNRQESLECVYDATIILL